jgi:tetratricopeptide (TPR) repeat protein
VISANALAHVPPKPARKEFDRGVQAWRKGQSEDAVRHLKDAIRIDPSFVEAQAELATVYTKSGQSSLALELLDRALALDPKSALLHSNKASVLIILDRPVEAEDSARRALQLDAAWIQAHYLLGAALLAQDRLTPEAFDHLSIAADQYPRARKFLTDAQAFLAGQEVK